MFDAIALYQKLLKTYGPQGWWPLIELHDKNGVNPTKSGSIKGYHPKDYSYPKNDNQRFEICVGAILTQNTGWPNVEKALVNLKSDDLLSARNILDEDIEKLKSAIRPAGYFNHKSRKVKTFAEFYLGLKGRTPSRNQLLGVWGIGPETADSILLYAYKKPFFVIDTYTRRLLINLNKISENEKYDTIKKMFEDNVPKNFKIYQEFHALIVENAKNV